MTFDIKLIENRIREVVFRETELPENIADDVAFHMTDWLEELAHFSQFCTEPETWEDKEIETMLFAFLVHAPDHVAAAAKLFTGLPVTDVFGVGATVRESTYGFFAPLWVAGNDEHYESLPTAE